MKENKLILILCGIIALLLMILAFFTGILYNRNSISSSAVEPPRTITSSAETSPASIRPAPGIAGTTAAAPSVGQQAGETYKQLEGKLQETYQKAGAQAEKTGGEIQQTAGETASVFRGQIEEAAQNLQKASDDMVKVLNQELEKFNETLKRPRAQT